MNKEDITKFSDILKIKRYAPNTVKTYVGAISSFMLFFNKVNVKDISKTDIQRYIKHKVKDKKISFSGQKGIVGAIKLFYKFVYDKDLYIDYLY